MIPPQISREANAPPGERELFASLEVAPETGDWIVLHSLDVADHRSRVAGEVDFVIIVPGLGVLCLEVKSHHRVECRDGRWYYGRARRPGQSPFRQVSETMHSLREQFGRQRPDLAAIPFWSAVCFPYIVFHQDSPEWHSWQVIEETRLRQRGIADSVRWVLRNARRYLSESPGAGWFDPDRPGPTPDECEAVAEVLRPHFEFYESPASRSRRRSEEIRHYTERQFRALDRMARSRRVAFVGPAGTGKTFLAIEAARRAVARGERVLLTCFNRALAAWVEEQVRDLHPALTTSTLHSLLLDLAGIRGDRYDSTFWQEELPERALEALLEGTAPEQAGAYDRIIVDEMQDLAAGPFLDVLDLLLDGGLRQGSWYLFGDFTNQNLYASHHFPGRPPTLSLEALLERYDLPTVFTLDENCRNTPRIVGVVKGVADADPGYAEILRPDNSLDPALRFFSSPEEEKAGLAAVLSGLYEDDVPGEEIVVLSMEKAEDSAAARLDVSPWKERLVPYSRGAGGHVRYSSIHAFKGLEAPAVIVTGVRDVGSSREQELLYVATSRAQDRLIILAHESAFEDLLELAAVAGRA